MADQVAGLIAEIVARPDDDGVRAVLADVLQAHNDPRGELISLQLLASRGNRDRDDRIRELLDEHAKGWLGWLREAARGCQFDRGFPRRLELAGEWKADDDRWEMAVNDRVLATVEELVPGGVHGTIYRKFLASPALGNLRAIEVFDRESLEGFEACTAAVTHVACEGFTTDSTYRMRARDERRRERRRRLGLDPWGYGGDPEGDAEYEAELDLYGDNHDPSDETTAYFTRLWSVLAGKPTVTSLAIPEIYFPIVRGLPWFDRISALTLGSSGSTVRRHLTDWDRRRRLTLVSHARLEPCDRDYPWDYKIELFARPEGAVATVSGEWLILPAYVLDALPPEIVRVEIESASDARAARIRDVITRSGIEVVLVPQRANNFVWEIR